MNLIETYHSKKTYIELENCLILFEKRTQMIKEDQRNFDENCAGLNAICDLMRKVLDEFELLIERGVTKE